MQDQAENPYVQCPTYETGRFIFRLVREADAEDLLSCYADPAAARIFNSDNCTSDFVYHTLEEMITCIHFWLKDYQKQGYVRFAVVDRQTGKAVGTLECFAKPQPFQVLGMVGVLRVDLGSAYETRDAIAEILEMVEAHFFAIFGVDTLITKSVPEAQQRGLALMDKGYQKLLDNPVMPFSDYYFRTLRR